MKVKKALGLISFLIFCLVLAGQTKIEYQSNISFSYGQGGSGDNLLIRNQVAPVVSIEYTRRFTRRLGVNTELTHYQRHLPLGLGLISDKPSIDFMLNRNSPFITDEVRDEIATKGIMTYDSDGSIEKFYSLVLSCNFNFSQMLGERFQFDFYLGPNLSYNTYKWYSNQSTVDFVLSNNETYQILYNENKEVRSLTLGNRAKMSIQYKLKALNIGLKIGNVNFFFLDWFDQDLTFWDSNIFISKDF